MKINQVELPGLSGSNPMGFLAAIGLVEILSARMNFSIRLAWKNGEHGWYPILSGPWTQAELLAALCNEFRRRSKADAYRPEMPVEVYLSGKHPEGMNGSCHQQDYPAAWSGFQKVLLEARTGYWNSGYRYLVDYLSGLGVDLRDSKKESKKKEESKTKQDKTKDKPTTPVRYLSCKSDLILISKGAGHQGFLKNLASILQGITDPENMIARTLFQSWDYKDNGLHLFYDPYSYSDAAFLPAERAESCGPTMLAAQWLAAESLAMFPCFPYKDKVRTVGVARHGSQAYFTWPLWTAPLSPPVIRLLLSHPGLAAESPKKGLKSAGFAEVYRSFFRRISTKGGKDMLQQAAPVNFS